ncbi:glycosyltransferase family 4 protein [Botrimarina hoheduenensis]|uniref:Putative glycosyl transferase n=1 Tax=Botrimarina hoheduenensis TaxID=2528000 RepID=A0A5C5W856_9BACT|nr:glycosyltransferase family 4 protein [Botrimarina hoheduenensis]TWT46774.1 putative glycosyl transferase [Botrimarina hoheduenensis]
MVDAAAERGGATPASARKRLLVISQVYPPDPAAVGQYLAEASAAIAKRGMEVRVLTSARGFDDPTAKYPPREMLDGVEVIRMPLSSFGKRSIAHRLVGMLMFLVQTLVRGLFTPRLGAILVSTSPPLASAVAVFIGWIRRAPITYWVMDLNPDQMIELGKISERSLAARVFDFFNRLILRRAAGVVALDRFMGDRLCRKHDVRDKLTVMPPWPHAEHGGGVPHEENPFRKEHGLEGKFVVMYSGNHALTNPIETILEAALRMQDRTELMFLFIGGGVRKKSVDDVIAQQRPTNLLSLPYQPLETIRYSLSAADVHLVTLGDPAVGCVHPCKVYGALALGRPILYVGPRPSHVTDLLGEETPSQRIGWALAHGDVEAAIAVLDAIRQTPRGELAAMGARAEALVHERFNSEQMIDEFCEVVLAPLQA